jgi:uncharacterized membrane protein
MDNERRLVILLLILKEEPLMSNKTNNTPAPTPTFGEKVKTTAVNILHANENARKRAEAEEKVKTVATAGVIATTLGIAVTAIAGKIANFKLKRRLKELEKNEVDEFEDIEYKVKDGEEL